MSLDDERKDIEGVYSGSPINGVAFGYDKQPFEIVAPAVQLTIRSGTAFQASLGSPGTNLSRTPGLAFFKVWTEGGKGSVEGNGIAETIMTLYRNKKLERIKTHIPYLIPIEDEEPHSILLIAVPYARDEFNA